MSKLNINKSEWLELVFEGKNKAYGAYQLREEDGKTTMKAFFGAMVLLTGIVGLGLLMSSFSNKVSIIKDGEDTIHVTDVTVQPIKEGVEVVVKKGEPIKQPKTKDLVNPVIVEAAKAPEIELTKIIDLGKTNDLSTTADNGKGDGYINGSTTSVIQTPEVIPTPGPDEIMLPTTVDEMPLFPGDFSKEIARKFVVPEMDEQKTLRVFVLFVVEKDGTISNIKVVNDPGFGMGAEAIRVLKAIKTKWEPGLFKGEKVRTSFSLPIVVRTATQE
jgi:periplasmic protein TonB